MVQFACTTHGARRQVPAATRLALVRATQEALVNARKHSGARTATVTLTYLDEEVSIDIVDDGVGFDPDAVGLRGEKHLNPELLRFRCGR